MHISRRGFLIAGVLLPVGLLRGGTPPHYESLLAAHFGRGIAAHPETLRFLDAIGLIAAPEKVVEEQLIFAFLTSTNVLAALDRGAPLEFSGLFDPYTSPCSNRLATIGGALQAHRE